MRGTGKASANVASLSSGCPCPAPKNSRHRFQARIPYVDNLEDHPQRSSSVYVR